MASPAITYTGHHPPGLTLTRYADGVILAVPDDGLLLDFVAAREMRRQMAAVAGGPYVVVSDLRGVPFVDRDARTLFADDETGRVLATAVVVGRDGPMQLLVDRWLADNEVRRPVTTFLETGPALIWGHQMAAELRAAGRFGES